MKNNRRDFLKLSGLAGLSIAGGRILSGFASESGQNSVNLVWNPGFETGEGTDPEGWIKNVPKNLKVFNMGIDNSQFHSGGKSYRITTLFSALAGIRIATPIKINPVKKYLLGFWYKTEGYQAAFSAQLRVQCEKNPSVTYSKIVFNSEQWQQYFVVLDYIPADAKELTIEFKSMLVTKGSFWIDDVDFREADKKDVAMFEKWRMQPIPKVIGKASGKKFDATGFFRVEKAKDRWWLVDPSGNATWALATVGEAPNIKTPQAQAEWFKKTYGTTEKKAAQSTYDILFNDLGFNWFAGWTGREFAEISAARFKTGQPYMPMTAVMELCSEGNDPDLYAQNREGRLLNTPGHEVADPFNPRWRLKAREKAERLISETKGKRWFAGWYIDNEMDFGELYRYVWAKYSSIEFINQLKAKYLTIDNLNQAWTSSFGVYKYSSFNDILNDKPEPMDWDDPLWEDFGPFERKMLREYINYTYNLVKGLDPDHLVISNRINLGPMTNIYRTIDLWGKYDIVCMNIYPNNGRIGFEPGELEIMKRLHMGTGRPIMIGEWSVPAIDSKLYEFGIDPLDRPLDWSWPQVLRTQKERGEAYEICVKQLASLDFMIGSGWFKTTDTNTKYRRANRGLMNSNFELYRDLTDAMKKANNEIKRGMELTS